MCPPHVPLLEHCALMTLECDMDLITLLMKQRRADSKRKVARLRALEGTRWESEKRMHSAQATLRACNPPPRLSHGSPHRQTLEGGPSRPRESPHRTGELCGGGQYLNPLVSVSQKPRDNPPHQVASSCRRVFHSRRATPLSCGAGPGRRREPRAARTPRGPRPEAQEGLLPSAPEEPRAGFPRGGSTSPRARQLCFCLLPADGGRRGRRGSEAESLSALSSPRTGRRSRRTPLGCGRRRKAADAQGPATAFSTHSQILAST
ncbi:unnamed protein product [Rangifer tarandus platyrhynchus]|uniref:Uncharacterized protein n=2 Tax=Rangifer tarandus platyrhynchus TaxID=3082113 RepID=A0ABN8Z6A0_RANTA|nr:unnamed protein product [Rangifer tarandus platyrhynchus]CAI9703725.1 unnamed protein product [Rangifer tarandus platyrhynchus]